MKNSLIDSIFYPFKKYLINIKFRVVKSAVAVFISLYISKLLNLPDLLSPSFVAVLCIQPTVYTGIKRGSQEFFVSLLGAVLSLLLVLPYGINLITVPITVALTIYIAIKLKLDDSIPIAIFTVLYITLFPMKSIWVTTKIRFLSILLGIGSASLVNYLISFVRYKYLFYSRILRVVEITYSKFSAFLEAVFDKDWQQLNNLLNSIDQTYKQVNDLKGEITDIQKEIKIRKSPGGINKNTAFTMVLILTNIEIIIHHLYDLTRVYAEIFETKSKISKNIDSKIKTLIGELLGFVRNIYKTLSSRNYTILESKEIKNDAFKKLMDTIKKTYTKNEDLSIKLFSIIINLQNINISTYQLRRLTKLYITQAVKKEGTNNEK